jgi:hypothetical protein
MDKQTTRNESAPLVASPNILAEHHRELDACIERLLARVRDGDPTELRPEWSAFERALLRHLEQEEVEILPGFARDNAAQAREILAEHAVIRAALLDMGVNSTSTCCVPKRSSDSSPS